ncbi:MAG: tRNA (N6-threonylcarbamoyladenosine(37)-N6)-methyltransferase TrmO [Acetobacter sp.]|nr:tRNA (N6-threonylcarbamoyladenosine(37)-N6)-methyltransferase TrmO [Bacteroides sp.]MCM1340274.1 tRNA (N6-threonylcarbamoyladenosine(37)-N6)-methyltransferase TrmO [Acetobacter sp.]MCM1432776.1 tRNA (N6-threonylcarbamoyladenosine(37)-N6)-methyltransferase TrmO [Clostridiales bacterium]
MKIIAKIYTDLPEKFGAPRQSGLVKELKGKIVFEPEYRMPEALDGIEEFSHLWILWQFSKNIREEFSPTVRPPRLGGEKRKGVFATRSPFRPNPIGMSCVKLEKTECTKNEGTVLWVSGVDMIDDTPIYDIKPYVTYTDSIPEAVQGFAEEFVGYSLNIDFPENLLKIIPKEKQAGIIGILKQDPRPAYQNDSERIYGVKYSDYDIHFTVNENRLTVIDIKKLQIQ